MTKIKGATKEYEAWLKRHTTVIESDVELKHTQMREALFPFLRATFYRWMQIWPEICSELDVALRRLAVGDLQVDNFGTRRDIEGRLISGINDLDEAYQLPYTLALVRLAASALPAIAESPCHQRSGGCRAGEIPFSQEATSNRSSTFFS